MNPLVSRALPRALSALAMGLTDRRRAIVIFGDSLTQRSFQPAGWGAALAMRYQRRVDVINRGYGGYNSRWCLAMVDELFPASARGRDKPLLVTVMLGTNDAALPEVEPAPTVPLEEYRSNLDAIVAKLKQRAEHVVVMTPPCMDEPGRLAYQRETYQDDAVGRLERTNANTRRYANAAMAVAMLHGVPCVDLFASTSDALESAAASTDGPTTLFDDGIHFNALGQEVVYASLVRVIESAPGLEDLDPEKMPSDWPFGPDLRANPDAWRETFDAHLEKRGGGGRGGVASPRSSVDWEGARGWIVAAGMTAAHFASRKLLGAR